MKISNPDDIRAGERKLIRHIAAHLDREAVKQTVAEAYGVRVNDTLSHQSGNLMVHRGEIVYRMDFSFKVNLSILISRDGEPVAIRSPELNPRRETAGPSLTSALPSGRPKDEESARKASEIARMMTEINEEEGQGD